MVDAMSRVQPSDVLTPREIQVLMAFSFGMDYEHTAELLSISTHTVHSHYQRAKRKLRAKNRAHAVALAIRQGLL